MHAMPADYIQTATTAITVNHSIDQLSPVKQVSSSVQSIGQNKENHKPHNMTISDTNTDTKRNKRKRTAAVNSRSTATVVTDAQHSTVKVETIVIPVKQKLNRRESNLNELLISATSTVQYDTTSRPTRMAKQVRSVTVTSTVTTVESNVKAKRVPVRLHTLTEQQQQHVRVMYKACIDGDINTVSAVLQGTYNDNLLNDTEVQQASSIDGKSHYQYYEPAPVSDSISSDDMVIATWNQLTQHPTPSKHNHTKSITHSNSKFDINFFGFQELMHNEDADTTLLHLAANNGQVQLVEYLLQNGIDIHCTDGNGTSPLDDAACSDNMDIARLLRIHGCELTTGKFGVTPLHTACAEGAINMVKYLIEVENTDINQGDKDGYAPLFWALDCTDSARRLCIIEYLVQHGANVNQRDTSGRTPLLWALRTWQMNEPEQRQPDVVALLLKYDADPYVVDNDHMSVFDVVENTDQDSPFLLVDQIDEPIQQRKHPLYPLMRRFVVDNDALMLDVKELPDRKGLDTDTESQLVLQLRTDRLNCQLFQKDMNVEYSDPFSGPIDLLFMTLPVIDTKQLPIYQHCTVVSSPDNSTSTSHSNDMDSHKPQQTIQTFNGKKSNSNASAKTKNINRHTILCIRALTGTIIPSDCTADVRKRLIEREYRRLACRWMLLQSLLYRAVKHDPHGFNKRTLQLLSWMHRYQMICIAHRQPIFKLQFDNRWYCELPVHISLSYVNDQLEIFNYLLLAGCDYNTTNSHGYKPIHTAAMWAPVEAVDKLIELGVDINQQHEPPGVPGEADYTPTGWTPLILAVDHPHSAVIAKSLLNAGADINLPDYNGNTPLIWAVFKAKLDMVSLLLQSPLLNRAQVNFHGCNALHYAVYRAGKSPNHMKCLRILIDAGMSPMEPINQKQQRPIDLLNATHDVDGLRTYNILRQWFQAQYSNDQVAQVQPAINDGSDGTTTAEYTNNNQDINNNPVTPLLMDDVISGDDIDALNATPLNTERTTKIGKSKARKKARLVDKSEHHILESCRREIQKYGLTMSDDTVSGEPLLCLDDVSRGLERQKIPLINTINDTLPTSEYVNEYILNANDSERVTSFCVSSLQHSCRCTTMCPQQCTCADKHPMSDNTVSQHNTPAVKQKDHTINDNKKNSRKAVQSGTTVTNGRNTLEVNSGACVEIVYECTDVCNCNKQECKNRAVQSGITVAMEVYLTHKKGWAARAKQPIVKGTFICEYIGELLGEKQALQRQNEEVNRMSYLFKLPGCSYTLDPQFKGNVARYFNHSCQPNLLKKQVYIGTQSGHTFPRVAFYAARNIAIDEELCMDYGYEESDVPGACMVCYCGNKQMCRQTLI